MKRLVFIIILLCLMLTAALSACGEGEVPAVTPENMEYTVTDDVERPVFSHDTGCYEDGFVLTVSAPKNTTVRYTTDGSQPTADSEIFPAEGLRVDDRSGEENVLAAIDASKFTKDSDHEPPTVNMGTVIRAAAFDSRGGQSRTSTATYIVGLDYEDIKIISLVMDSDDLFGYEKGIYVLGRYYDEWLRSAPGAEEAQSWEVEGNFSQKGRSWERPVTVQLIESDGSFGFEQDMGIRIMGAASRRYYQKSFRLIAREEYGSKHLKYDLIDGLVTDADGQPLQKYKSVNLRNGGNDGGYSLLRDPFIQSLVADRDMATQAAEPAIVFINGEYWGLYSITEDYSDNYIQYNYGVDNENVVMVKGGVLEEGTEEDMALYDPINEAMYVRRYTSDEDYEWLCSVLDIQSFIDYFCVQLYINNQDGPIQDNNWRIWRARETDPANEYADGKWRFMLYDTDMSLGLYNEGSDYTDNTLAESIGESWGWGALLKKLMQNDDFKCQFVNTFMDLRSTAFLPERAVETLTRLKLRYEPYTEENYLRNGPAWVIQWTDVTTRFTTEVNYIRKFINGRYSYAEKMLTEALCLGECFTLTVNVSDVQGGVIKVNTVTPDLTDGGWSGEYFSGCPVTVTALPASGYEFAGWTELPGDDAALTLDLTADTTLTAVFKRK